MASSNLGGLAPHEVLGVPSDADISAIRKQFLREARTWHPDKRPDTETVKEQLFAKSRFLAVQEAYEKLVAMRELSHEHHEATHVQCSLVPDGMLNVTSEDVENAKTATREAEAYFNDVMKEVLHDPQHRFRTWRTEDQEIVKATSVRAFRALEAAKREQSRLEHLLVFKTAILEVQLDRTATLPCKKDRRRLFPCNVSTSPASSSTRLPLPLQEWPLSPVVSDGPSNVNDRIEGVPISPQDIASGSASALGVAFDVAASVCGIKILQEVAPSVASAFGEIASDALASVRGSLPSWLVNDVFFSSECL